MKKSLKTAALLLFSAAVMLTASCSMIDTGEMNIGRTLLIYIAADNNLAANAENNIHDIMAGDVPYYFNEGGGDVLLVYADIRGEKPCLMRISKDAYGAVNQEILMEYEDQNSLSDSVMRSVLSYAAELFPSSEHSLVLWSHGTGWLPEGYYSNPVYASSDGGAAYQHHIVDPYADLVKSFGEDGGSEMDIKALAKALPVHYSFILMDACLMGGIEVAYELRDCCDYFIGSAAEVLANGFPYEQVVGEFFDGERGLRNACRLFYEHYEDEGATVSMVDTRRLDALAYAGRAVFASKRGSIQDLDMSSIQGYYRMDRHWFYDLDDFIFQLTYAEDSALYEDFKEALDDAVVCKYTTDEFVLNGYTQFSINKFSGLSTYIPNPENPILDEYYRTLAWNKAVMMVE